jgi:hypothetical protein
MPNDKAKEEMPRGVKKRLDRLDERRRIEEAREIAAKNKVRELEARLSQDNAATAETQPGQPVKE